MSAEKLLARLDRPKQTRPGCWVAGCPCCQSQRGRPLSVRELDDGRVLLNAFCGCATEAVLGALGLTLTDLFPTSLHNNSSIKPFTSTGPRIPARDLLAVVSEELTVVAIVAANLLQHRLVNQHDWERFAMAAHRIQRARDCLYGGY